MIDVGEDSGSDFSSEEPRPQAAGSQAAGGTAVHAAGLASTGASEPAGVRADARSEHLSHHGQPDDEAAAAAARVGAARAAALVPRLKLGGIGLATGAVAAHSPASGGLGTTAAIAPPMPLATAGAAAPMALIGAATADGGPMLSPASRRSLGGADAAGSPRSGVRAEEQRLSSGGGRVGPQLRRSGSMHVALTVSTRTRHTSHLTRNTDSGTLQQHQAPTYLRPRPSNLFADSAACGSRDAGGAPWRARTWCGGARSSHRGARLQDCAAGVWGGAVGVQRRQRGHE